MCSEILVCVHVCLDVFVSVTVHALLGSEDDSKCHVVWGQPSQMYLSCRRCCHTPLHCLYKWCPYSPSNTWRFHPSSVTLLSLLLWLYKLSHHPSAPVVSNSLLLSSPQNVLQKRIHKSQNIYSVGYNVIFRLWAVPPLCFQKNLELVDSTCGFKIKRFLTTWSLIYEFTWLHEEGGITVTACIIRRTAQWHVAVFFS